MQFVFDSFMYIFDFGLDMTEFDAILTNLSNQLKINIYFT